MKQKLSWANRVWQGMELWGESAPLQSVLELCGDGRLLIENHFGVSEYTVERICVKVRFGQILISGCGLKLRRMQGQVLVITGRIEQISVIRGRK